MKSFARTTSSSSASLGEQQPLFLQEPYVRATLAKGNYEAVVKTPEAVDGDEWIAANRKSIFNEREPQASNVRRAFESLHSIFTGFLSKA